jgi:hypothetical protein
MNSNTKGVIAVGITLGVIGLAYYLVSYKKSNKIVSGSDNFEAVKANLGGKFDDSSDVAITKFNSDKNIAQFYKNNRLAIFDANTKSLLKKGNYSDGGRIIQMDGGSELTNSSVWTNLINALN